MRVPLVSEGKHERGRCGQRGALEILARRLTGADAQFDHDRLARRDIHAHHGKSGGGYTKKAIRWMRQAEKDGYDAVALLVDEDGKPERIREIDDAQDSEIASIPRALGVAIRTFDAWMLADDTAVSSVLETHVGRQKDIETLSDPKQVARHLLAESGKSISQTEMYADVADRANLATIEERCPNGFAPFSRQLCSMRLE